MAIANGTTRADELRRHWEQYRAENKRAFRYDAARALKVSEAELLAIDCGQDVTRIEGDWNAMLKSFDRLGRVMTLTRNEHAVHEKKGTYKPVSFQGHVGLVLDAGIDLRLFMNNWSMGFAVNNPLGKAFKRSFQFFDASGQPVHKVFADDNAAEAFDEITAQYTSENQEPWQDVAPAKAVEAARPDSEIDVEGLRRAWSELKDTHDFYPMLRKFNVKRTQAHRLVGAPFAERLATNAYREVFQKAAAQELPIMVFVGNKGAIQIHTGVINKLFEMEGWYNIMDPDFNLHLSEGGVAETWLTRKPTTDGTVTGVELFDADGEDIAILFGKRKPGIPELEEWRTLAESLPRA